MYSMLQVSLNTIICDAIPSQNMDFMLILVVYAAYRHTALVQSGIESCSFFCFLIRIHAFMIRSLHWDVETFTFTMACIVVLLHSIS